MGWSTSLTHKAANSRPIRWNHFAAGRISPMRASRCRRARGRPRSSFCQGDGVAEQQLDGGIANAGLHRTVVLRAPTQDTLGSALRGYWVALGGLGGIAATLGAALGPIRRFLYPPSQPGPGAR